MREGDPEGERVEVEVGGVGVVHGFDVAVGVGRLVGEAGGGAEEGVGFETYETRTRSGTGNRQYRQSEERRALKQMHRVRFALA